MTRLRGRSLGGRRIHEATPGGHRKIMTVLGAISTSGILAARPSKQPRMPIFSWPIWIMRCVRC